LEQQSTALQRQQQQRSKQGQQQVCRLSCRPFQVVCGVTLALLLLKRLAAIA
jgi:hypothetical protein